VLEYTPNGDIKCMRSAQPSNAQLNTLKEQNFSTIVNLRSVHTQAEYAAALGLNYYTIPIQNVQPSPDQVELFLEILSDESNYPMLIHCGQGIHRTGVMSAIYRIEMQNWSNEQAAEEMVSNVRFYLTHRDVWHCKEFILNYQRQHARP
jgi:protein tyrosine/serine phosphatase